MLRLDPGHSTWGPVYKNRWHREVPRRHGMAVATTSAFPGMTCHSSD